CRCAAGDFVAVVVHVRLIENGGHGWLLLRFGGEGDRFADSGAGGRGPDDRVGTDSAPVVAAGVVLGDGVAAVNGRGGDAVGWHGFSLSTGSGCGVGGGG